MSVATIIIPCGPKHIPLLDRAVRSAYAQTVPVEVLTYIDTERHGPAFGRNRLAERVTTPFLVQLDADDWLMPDAVEEWLKAWEPGYYVTSDWYQGLTHVKAVSCYGVQVLPGEANFHLPPALIPTAYWHKVGGQNETLFGAEDTEFYFRLNTLRIHHKVVRKPLFHYTPDGYRSKEAANDPRWLELLNKLFGKYRKDMTVGCCGDIKTPNKTLAGEKQPGDLTARPNWRATQKTTGRFTGRMYGRINNTHTIYLDPKDYAANPREWTLIEDWQALAPTKPQIQQTLKIDPNDPVAVLEHQIALAGIRTSWEPVVTSGYDMQQTPRELATFLVWCREHNVKTVLEIGTGDSAGLARFMVKDMGWTVTSVDKQEPKSAGDLVENEAWDFIQADTQKEDLTDLFKSTKFDLVFIDAAHEYEAAKKDYDQFSPLGRIVAVHDIATDGWYADGVAQFWQDTAYTPKGNLKKGYHEIVTGKQGIGWHEQS